MSPRASAVLGVLLNTAPALAEQPPSSELEVSVQGERTAEHVRREPTVASTVIRGEALEQAGATSMDVLERIPGVQITRTGARSDLATASIRGATSAQTPIYVAGIAINDDVSGTADLSSVPLWLMDRVEVFRGNAPAEADRLGIGGAVFFEPRLPRANEAAAGAAVGSYGYRGVWALGGVRGDRSSALVGVRRESAENDYPYVDDQGTRFNTADDVEKRRVNADYRSYDVWALGRHELASGARVLTLLNAYDREQGVTGLSVIPAEHARARVRRLLGGLSSLVPCDRDLDACQLELTTSALISRTRLLDPAGELSSDSAHTDSDGERVAEQMRITKRLTPWLRSGVTLRQSFDRLAIAQGRGESVRARRSTSRAAVNATASLNDEVGVHLLGALECHGTEASGSGSTCGVFEPMGRVGAEIALTPELSLLGNVGRYVRVPTLGELFGVSALVRGNSDLVTESGTTIDLGARLATRARNAQHFRAYLDGFGFWREVRDLISYRRSSFSAITPYNVGQARIYGAELAAGAEAFDALILEATGTVLQPLNTTPDRQETNDVLPFRSRLVASGRAELYWKPEGSSPKAPRLAVATRLSRRSSRFADPAGLIVIPSQTTTDFEISAHLLERSLALRCALQNAFDVRTFDTVGLPLPGRTFYASLDLSFGRSL